MQSQLKTLKLIISGRYESASHQNENEEDQQQHSNIKMRSYYHDKNQSNTIDNSNNKSKHYQLQIEPKFKKVKGTDNNGWNTSKGFDQRKKSIGQMKLNQEKEPEQEQEAIYYEVDEKKQQNAMKIIKDKYKTFVNWDLRKSLPKVLKGPEIKKDVKKSPGRQLTSTSMNFSAIMIHNQDKNRRNSNRSIKDKLPKQKKDQQKRQSETIHLPQARPRQQRSPQAEQTPQMIALKQERRERLLKQSNPIHLLKHYIQKQNFIPSSQQKHLIQKLIKIQKSIDNDLMMAKQSGNSTASNTPNGNGSVNWNEEDMVIQKQDNGLEEVLTSLYQLMNLAVDYNQLLFLALLTCLAADICYFVRDYPRAFYFYNQARIAGSYAKMDKLKIPALMGIGRVCYQVQFFDEAKRIFRKALQYAWRNSDQNTELEVYDNFGLVCNQKGKIRQSLYYHEKFAKNSLEPQYSALKKISREMLQQYDKHIESLQNSNLDTLFLQYIHLPLNKTFEVKPKQNQQKAYKNYTNSGKSPRMHKEVHDFSRQSFPDVKFQLQNLLQQDYEFKTEIPDPDKPGSRQLNRLFSKSRYGQFEGKRRQLDFEHSIEYNKIMKKKAQKPKLEKQLKKPLDEQVQDMLRDKLDPNWYENMVHDIKKRRVEKMGELKQRVRNSHLSYSKYPNQRKRQVLWSIQKINQSFNRTLLDWIDPLQ